MQFCQAHWDSLKTAIDARGLSGLVAGSGEKAAGGLVRQLEGRDTAADFDPLMNAHWAILNQALSCGGLYLMGADENGLEYCPLCEADRHGGVADDWISACADAQREHAIELQLVTVN